MTDSGTYDTNDNAKDSICPRGWRLPTSGNTASQSFGHLLTEYGVQSGAVSGKNTIYGVPLYFLYGGYLYSGNLDDVGWRVHYWSSTLYSDSENVYDLLFAASVIPSNHSPRSSGYLVRCLHNPDIKTSEDLTPRASGNALISVNVKPVISLDVATTSTSDSMTMNYLELATSDIVVNVSSNYQYTVGISTDQTKLLPTITGSDGSTTADSASFDFIPMLGTDGNNENTVKARTSGWGIQKKKSALDGGNPGDSADDTKYSPVGIGTANPVTFYKSAGAEALNTATDNALEFHVGVGIAPTLPSGKYSTTVTITAGVV